MAITGQEAREEIVGDLGGAVERLTLATARLAEAYEMLSVDSAERLEAALFMPAQRALGRCMRARAEFARRSGIAVESVDPPPPGPPSQGAQGFVEGALSAAREADLRIASIQDSDLLIEFGDRELRAALGEAREALDRLPLAAREFLRTLGR